MGKIKLTESEIKQIVFNIYEQLIGKNNNKIHEDDFKLKDLREWVNSIPEKYNNYNIVVSQEGKLTEEKNFRLDRPIIGLAIDPETKEGLIKINFDNN